MKTYHVTMTSIYFDTIDAENKEDAIFQMEQRYSDDWEEIEVEEIEE